MEIQTIRHNLEQMPDSIEILERAYLEEKAKLEYMDDLKKQIVAIEKEKHSGSHADRETKAYASESYRIHIEGRREQAINLAIASSKFHCLERKFEAMRSLNKNV